jgi:hypothetical protein
MASVGELIVVVGQWGRDHRNMAIAIIAFGAAVFLWSMLFITDNEPRSEYFAGKAYELVATGFGIFMLGTGWQQYVASKYTSKDPPTS